MRSSLSLVIPSSSLLSEWVTLPSVRTGSTNNNERDGMTQRDNALLLRCTFCKKERPRGWFERSGEGRRLSWCRDCARARNSAKLAKRRGAGVTAVSAELLQRLYRKQLGMCPLCGLGMQGIAGTHVDHIIPVSRGGEHTESNLQLTHKLCNLRKGNRYSSAMIPRR